jgi:O-antigen ligase
MGHSALPLQWKRALIWGVLAVGLVGFGIKYASFFEKQRNSVGARFIYWRAALLTTKSKPLFGTGPGTFAVPFAELKRPQDEMARLCHNDYLEQATDSGIIGFILYTAMIFVIFFKLYRYSMAKNSFNWIDFSLFLGLLGIALHSTVEFHLYIPALAWTFFFLMGWQFRHSINVNV